MPNYKNLRLAALVIAAAASNVAAADDLIALQLPGVPGDPAFSSDVRIANAIEILSLSNGVVATITRQGGGGISGGMAHFSDLAIVKHFDAASPALFLSVASGKHYANATVTFFHNNGNVQALLQDHVDRSTRDHSKPDQCRGPCGPKRH